MKYNIDFEILEETDILGKGGISDLYKGNLLDPALIHLHGYRSVAVKMNRNVKHLSRESFRYEIVILSSFKRCPYLVDFIGYCESPVSCFVMKRYDITLNSLLFETNTELSNLASLQIALDISCGMSIVHSNDIVHLDLKPST